MDINLNDVLGDRMLQDFNEEGINWTLKAAHITVRFLGERAEAWAKAFHHLCGRQTPNMIWSLVIVMLKHWNMCGLIIPINVDYFGVGNTSIAFSCKF